MAIPFIQEIQVQEINRKRGSWILLGFIVFFVCCVTAALICVPIILYFQTQALQSFRTDLKCFEGCLGNQQCTSNSKCINRLLSSDDVNHSTLTPNYSRAKNAEVIEDKTLAQKIYDVIDQGKPRSTGYRIKWVCEDEQKKYPRCSKHGEIMITTGGCYSYHLHTTFKDTNWSTEQKDHSAAVSHQLIKKAPGRDHTLVNDVTHCGTGRCTLESTGVVYLGLGDQMQATFKICDSKSEVCDLPSEFHFSLFRISIIKLC